MIASFGIRTRPEPDTRIAHSSHSLFHSSDLLAPYAKGIGTDRPRLPPAALRQSKNGRLGAKPESPVRASARIRPQAAPLKERNYR